MRDARPTNPVSDPVRKEVAVSVGRWAFREFNVAFALMSLIPLLTVVYILAAKLFTLSIFEGAVGVYFLIAIVIALLGFLVGRQLLRVVVSRLVNVTAQLRQHELMKSAFVANVAYELRPPLAAVQTSLKNLSDGLLGPVADSQARAITDCHGIVGRLVRLTTDLIGVTNPQTGPSALQRETVEVQGLLREVVRLGQPYLNAHRLQITMKLPEQPVIFFGDRARLLQAFESLIDHAVRWSSEGSAVTVELRAILEGWQIVVSHDIAPSQMGFAQAFESLRRLGANVDEYLGLGFRLVKEIAELHYGRFWVEGDAGRARRLIVNLPSLEHQEAGHTPPSA